MKRRKSVLRVGLVAVLVAVQLLGVGGVASAADSLSLEPNLVFRVINITGDDFVELQNAGTETIEHLSDYWLGYTSDDAATAPPLQQLPDRHLGAGQVILLSSGGTVDICDASLVTDLSPVLSNTEGSLALWKQTGDSFARLTTDQSQARWSKSSSSNVLPPGEIDLKQEAKQYVNPVWYFDAANGWTVADLAACSLTVYASPADEIGTQIITWPPNTSGPPAVIVSLAEADPAASGPYIPSADVGLKPPQLSEILPNPASPQTDAEDEFIELYNPNKTAFDLSGFKLQVGITTTHTYEFPSGTVLPAGTFRAFFSANTGLSLSNSGGQAVLLDPFDTVIAQTDIYAAAKDGQAWAIADGTWYWTLQATPNATNRVAQVPVASSAASGNEEVRQLVTSGSVKGAATAPVGVQNETPAAEQVTPIHPWVLAAVAAIALLYGAYEYRVDVANRLYQFRKHRENRRRSRP